MNENAFMIEDFDEFDNHRLVSMVQDERAGLKGFIAIHRGGLQLPAFGATRVWKYPSPADALKDALKLSQIMSYKCALAGVKYGGAKAVLFAPDDLEAKKKMLTAYARQLNYFHGHFITGSDVGVSMDDVKLMAQQSKDIVGIKTDPVTHTVLGVYYSVLICLNEIFGTDTVSNHSFAIQGLGKTGFELLKLLSPQAQKIYVCDLDVMRVKSVVQQFKNVQVVESEDIYTQKVDVFMPCAVSNSINSVTLPKLTCKIVAGSANGQLENKEIAHSLHERGILYAPDYVINAGGLIAVVDEYENGDSQKERVQKKVEKIKTTLQQIILKSKQSGISTALVANEAAEKIFSRFI